MPGGLDSILAWLMAIKRPDWLIFANGWKSWLKAAVLGVLCRCRGRLPKERNGNWTRSAATPACI